MTKDAALGYMVMAAKRLEMDEILLRQLELTVKHLMETVDVEKAEKVYDDF